MIRLSRNRKVARIYKLNVKRIILKKINVLFIFLLTNTTSVSIYFLTKKCMMYVLTKLCGPCRFFYTFFCLSASLYKSFFFFFFSLSLSLSLYLSIYLSILSFSLLVPTSIYLALCLLPTFF